MLRWQHRHLLKLDRLPDFFLRERKYKPPVSTYGAVILAGTAAVAYGLWAEYCASYNGTCKRFLRWQ